MPSGFFVKKAKLHNLSDHIAQAVGEMYACIKYLQKNAIRSALTNGREWIFLFIMFNDGASYYRSTIVDFATRKSNGRLVLIRILNC